MSKLKEAMPFKINRIQTDNGQEFEKCFAKYVRDNNIIHYHNYPKCPKSNAFIERFNRTIKEQYVQCNHDKFYEANEFRRGLAEYLVWYNTVKAHKGLNFLSPLQALLQNKNLNVQKSNMY